MKAGLYHVPQTVQRFERQGRVILINPIIPAWIVTNEAGELIVRLLDGEHTVAEVVHEAVDVLGEDYHSKVERLLLNVIDSHLLDEEAPQEQHPRDKQLNMVHLSIASGCNLRCRYCYAAERTEQGRAPLDAAQWCKVIDDLVAMNPAMTFTLTGGEPLLNRDWPVLAERIKQHGCQLAMLTNGTLITPAIAKEMARWVDRVTLSIDGSTPASHARTRGDNYEQVVRAIDLLDEVGLSPMLSMTVTRVNLDQVEPLARRYGSRLNFAPLFPVSDVAHDDLSITGDEYYRVLENAFGVNPLGYCEAALDYSQVQRVHKCAIGDNEISISATGDVYPCQLLHVPSLLAGNVQDQPIAEIYHHAEALKRCAALDVDNIEGCRDCAIRYICGGACRARAYYETGGHIDRTGDFCSYEFNAFLDGIVKIYSSNAL